MKIALFFGSFNPIHVGHLLLAQAILNETDLEKIWFVISPQNPFKQKKSLLNVFDRIHMAELATENNPKIDISAIETQLPIPSYTVDTLTHLKDLHPDYEFSVIMGEDNLTHFHKWKNYETILKYYKVFVYPRFDKTENDTVQHENIIHIDAPRIEISATKIREYVKAEKSIRHFVPEKVLNYIENNNLYQDF